MIWPLRVIDTTFGFVPDVKGPKEIVNPAARVTPLFWAPFHEALVKEHVLDSKEQVAPAPAWGSMLETEVSNVTVTCQLEEHS